MTITCRPSRPFFLFLFVSFFMFTKNYTSIAIYEKKFSLYTYIPTHDELFLYTHALKLFLFTSTRSIYKPYSCSKISFSFFPTHTRSLCKSFFIYTCCSHTQEFLFTHYLHTQNPSIHIFFYIYIKKLFSFLCIHRHDICSQHFFLFLIFGVIMIFVHFIFRTTFLNENSTRFLNFNKHY